MIYTGRVLLLVFGIILLSPCSRAQHGGDTVFFTKLESLVLFEHDVSDLDSISKNTLEGLRKFLREHEKGLIRLEGRTDHTGSEAYNLKLAQQRVESIKEYLMGLGFEEKRFKASIFGQSNPLASNKTDAGRRRNRSVRIQCGFDHAVEYVDGRVVSDSTGEGLSTILFVQSRFHFDTTRTGAEGSFQLRVPSDEIISIEAYGDGHVITRRFINLRRDDTIGTVRALPILSGKVFHFDDILFVGNKDIVLEQSRHLLPRLSFLIKGAPKYRFEIQGHVNGPNQPVGEEGSWYHRLSEMRARRIYEYLLKTGIDSNRVRWKGYSNKRMLFPHTTDPQEMQKNRRVSIKVLGQYNAALKPR